MADATKHLQISGGTVLSEVTNVFFFMRRRRTMAFAYGFFFVFVAVTAFLAFNPNYNSSSPWLSSIFSTSAVNNNNASDSGGGSQFASVYSYFFPDKSESMPSAPAPAPTSTAAGNGTGKVEAETELSSNSTMSFSKKNATESSKPAPMGDETKLIPNSTASFPKKEAAEGPQPPPVGDETKLKPNTTTSFSQKNATESSKSTPLGDGSKLVSNNTASFPKKNATESSKQASASVVADDVGLKSNHTATFPKKNATESSKQASVVADKKESNNTATFPKKEAAEIKVEALLKCDLFDGNWVKDESYPLYKPGSCSLIDEQFDCVANGRPDFDYMKLKWKPKGCSIPRLDASQMLKLLRGKRLVYVGDSLNRNMWESMVCILKGAVKNRKNVYEAHGRHNFRAEASYSFVFKDYNFSVEFFVSPFLVREWEMSQKNGAKKETLRLDLMGQTADSYKGADIIVFNTGHWWTHDKTSKGEDYYQEGNHVYRELNVLEAFRKALTTWGRWVDRNIDPSRTLVFFRGYSASHFSGGQWNSGGACDSETEPIKNETYLTPYPSKMTVLEKVLHGMKTPVSYLNITRITDFRKDGHPSIYRRKHIPAAEQKTPLKYQDCSHWCLPGVPDTWNEILYAQLLVKDYERRHKQKTS